MNSQRAFLLSFIKYGENDAILHCFTEEDGFQTYFLKGIYSKRNKKKALLQPLNQLNISISMGKSSGIRSISKFELVKNNDIYTDIKINTVIFFVSDFLNQILRNEDKNLILFFSIDEFIGKLSSLNYQSHLIFLIKILKIHGITPLVNVYDFLDPETGTFSLSQTHQLFNHEVSSLWKSIISSENPYEIKINSSFRKDFLDSILVYYHYHISDFKIPTSLEIIQQIFE
ncbi:MULTISPECIES: DNA repair protein RecO [Chryseobacterium]|uniref:DNA repair protein RecO n=1 Tax=Chryseobacterium TaxID=59732 RepID=UPI001BE70FC6|nr:MULTISPECIES: recombination protein O N-terminal domain-containing protein [Chryseobacterium]MBT2621028.1 recombination protein O N-terminal domain-containing protein [Chryseobacterium sp. ISL-6]